MFVYIHVLLLVVYRKAVCLDLFYSFCTLMTLWIVYGLV